MIVAVAAWTAGCGKDAKAPAEAAPSGEAAAPSPGGESKKAGKEEPAADSAAPDEAAPSDKPAAGDDDATPGKADADGGEPDEVWLVWSADANAAATSWVEVRGTEKKVVADVPALVVSDGAKLWRVDRHHSQIDLIPCGCMDEEDRDPDLDCTPQETADLPWLEAVPLAGGKSIEVTAPGSGSDYGSDVSYDVSISGGVGSTLFYEESQSGYFCGAHPLYDTVWKALDLASNEHREEALDKIGPALPHEDQQHAAEQMLEEVQGCEGDEGRTVADIVDAMSLVSLTTSIEDGPKVDWVYAYDLPYVCSADYSSYGSAQTGPQSVAASLGLGSATPGQQAALSDTGGSPAGWARITAAGPERGALLELFRKQGKPDAKPAAVPAKVDTGALLNEARRETRKGEYAKAIAALDRLLAADPSHARGLSSRGYAKLLAGDLPGAKKDLENALKSKPDDDAFAAAIHFNLGMLAEKQKDDAAAKKAYQRSNELRPSKQAKAALDRLGG